MRAESAGSLPMSRFKSCALDLGSSTSSMIPIVTSGSVAMCETCFTAAAAICDGSNFTSLQWVADSDIRFKPPKNSKTTADQAPRETPFCKVLIGYKFVEMTLHRVNRARHLSSVPIAQPPAHRRTSPFEQTRRARRNPDRTQSGIIQT